MSSYIMRKEGVMRFEETHYSEKLLGWDCILVVHPCGGADGGPYAVIIDGFPQCVGVPAELRDRAEAEVIKAAADPKSPVGRYNAPEAVAARDTADEKKRATQVARRQPTPEGRSLSRAQLRDERDAELESGWGYD